MLGMSWCNSPVAAKAVDIFQKVLKKITSDPSKWPENVSQTTFEVNNREITHLLHSPAQILLGFKPTGATAIQRQEDIPPSEDRHFETVIEFLLRRYEIRREVLWRSDRQKDLKAQKNDVGVRRWTDAWIKKLKKHTQRIK
ncbi:hypothetical protein EPUL_001160, partial [Erysiphe pulchra]